MREADRFADDQDLVYAIMKRLKEDRYNHTE